MHNVVHNADFELYCNCFEEYKRIYGFGVVDINLRELWVIKHTLIRFISTIDTRNQFLCCYL